MLQRSTAMEPMFVDLKPSHLEHEEREVLACFRCRLVQFRTRTSLCRRCHKPLDGVVRNRTELNATGTRPLPAAMDGSDAVRNLGMRVRRVRKDRGLTQRVLASRMHVPRTYISKVEMGRVMPTLETLGRIAAGLEINVTHLLSDESERLRDDAISRIMDDPFLAEIAQLAVRLNAVHRALILRAVRDAASDHRPAAIAVATTIIT